MQAEKASQTFGEYTHDVILNCLNTAQNGRHGTHPADQNLLAAINFFLNKENAPIIDINDWENIPNDLGYQLSIAFDNRALNLQENPFNSGPDMTHRVNSYERNQSLAELLEAIHTHVLDAEKRGQYKGSSGTAADPDNEEIHLWKREILHDAGTQKSGLRPVDDIDFDDHVVLCLGGIDTMHSKGKIINGFMKQAESLLGGPDIYTSRKSDKTPALYCLSHPDDYRIRYGADVLQLNADPTHHYPAYIDRFVRDTLVPSLKLDANDLTPATLKMQMRKLNLFTFSYGSCVVKEVRNALADYLQERGMQPEEIANAFAEVYSLNIHPTCRIDTPHACGDFSSVYVVSKNDSFAPARADYEKFIPAHSKTPALIPVGDNQLMVWRNDPAKGVAWDKPIAGIAQIDGSVVAATSITKRGIPERAESKSGHDLKLSTERLEVTPEPDQDVNDPAYVAYSLRNGVEADHLPKDLVETLSPKAGDTREAFPLSALPANDFTMREAIRKHFEEAQTRQSP